MRIFRKLAQLLDVAIVDPQDGDGLTYSDASGKWENAAGGGGGGAPTDATYLTATSNSNLDAEVVVGATPGGELGGTWASPTVDVTHSGSSHASVQAAAEATAASALSAHSSDTTGVHGIADTSALVLTGDSRLSDSRTPTGSAGGVLGGTYPNPSFAADMATQAELDAAISGLSASYQPLDSDLTAIAALTTTSFGRAFLALADAAATRTALGLVIGTNVQAFDADLSTYAGITPSANVQSLLGAADYAAMRTLLGLVIGTNVQAFDQDLADVAGLTRTKGDLIVGTSSAWTDLAVGSDGQVLTADAASTPGVKWAAAGGGGGSAADDENLILHMRSFA